MAKDTKETQEAPEETASAAPVRAFDYRRATGPDAVLRFWETFPETDDEGNPTGVTGARERVLHAKELEDGYWYFAPESQADEDALNAMGAQVARKAMGMEEEAQASQEDTAADKADASKEDVAGVEAPGPEKDKE